MHKIFGAKAAHAVLGAMATTPWPSLPCYAPSRALPLGLGTEFMASESGALWLKDGTPSDAPSLAKGTTGDRKLPTPQEPPSSLLRS
mmetsp:Transcript_35611/g.70412  ORF Transcript_35611/g.70412 Transcript_35611/m.70412 type:complete len:87 (+) Transcript_35611:47-307(+)